VTELARQVLEEFADASYHGDVFARMRSEKRDRGFTVIRGGGRVGKPPGTNGRPSTSFIAANRVGCNCGVCD